MFHYFFKKHRPIVPASSSTHTSIAHLTASLQSTLIISIVEDHPQYQSIINTLDSSVIQFVYLSDSDCFQPITQKICKNISEGTSMVFNIPQEPLSLEGFFNLMFRLIDRDFYVKLLCPANLGRSYQAYLSEFTTSIINTVHPHEVCLWIAVQDEEQSLAILEEDVRNYFKPDQPSQLGYKNLHSCLWKTQRIQSYTSFDHCFENLDETYYDPFLKERGRSLAVYVLNPLLAHIAEPWVQYTSTVSFHQPSLIVSYDPERRNKTPFHIVHFNTLNKSSIKKPPESLTFDEFIDYLKLLKNFEFLNYRYLELFIENTSPILRHLLAQSMPYSLMLIVRAEHYEETYQALITRKIVLSHVNIRGNIIPLEDVLSYLKTFYQWHILQKPASQQILNFFDQVPNNTPETDSFCYQKIALTPTSTCFKIEQNISELESSTMTLPACLSQYLSQETCIYDDLDVLDRSSSDVLLITRPVPEVELSCTTLKTPLLTNIIPPSRGARHMVFSTRNMDTLTLSTKEKFFHESIEKPHETFTIKEAVRVRFEIHNERLFQYLKPTDIEYLKTILPPNLKLNASIFLQHVSSHNHAYQDIIFSPEESSHFKKILSQYEKANPHEKRNIRSIKKALREEPERIPCIPSCIMS